MERNFLLMVTESNYQKVMDVFGGVIQLLEVQGLDIAGSEDKYKVLINPMVPQTVVEVAQPITDEAVNE